MPKIKLYFEISRLVFSSILFVSDRYRKFDLGDDINLIVRCEHDAVTQGPSGENIFLNIKTLNEWDSKVSYAVI